MGDSFSPEIQPDQRAAVLQAVQNGVGEPVAVITHAADGKHRGFTGTIPELRYVI
jgi:hypothetical protein